VSVAYTPASSAAIASRCWAASSADQRLQTQNSLASAQIIISRLHKLIPGSAQNRHTKFVQPILAGGITEL
jgi:hypothetical protein